MTPKKAPPKSLDELLTAAKNKDFVRVGEIVKVMNPANMQDRRTGEAFIRTAIAGENKVLKQFIDKGIDVNLTVNESTALGASALRTNIATVRLLLRSGADVNQRSKEGDTPLIAVCRGAEIAQMFKFFDDHEKTASILLKAGADVNSQNLGEMSALHYAAQAAATKLCKLLVKAGADVTLRDIAGGTALESAAMRGDMECANILLKQGADVNTKDALGLFPLYAAAVWDRESMVKLLLEAGADANASNKNNETALDAARREGRTKIVKLLTNWSKKR
jgi:ankyrin repeat protein